MMTGGATHPAEQTAFFLAVCHDCRPVLPMPFAEEAQRDEWLQAHTEGTGHHVSRRYEERPMSEPVNVLSEMAAALRAGGYLVVKIPPCNRDVGHGRHSLITRSAMCGGREPIPHAPINGYFGSFGWRVVCACGGTFATYDEPSEWDEHKAEHDITEEPCR